MNFSLIKEINESVESLVTMIEAAELDFFNSSALFEDIEWKDDPENKKFVGTGKTGETGAGMQARRERAQLPAKDDVIRLTDAQGKEVIAVIQQAGEGKVSYAYRTEADAKPQLGTVDAARLTYRATTKGGRKVFTIQNKSVNI